MLFEAASVKPRAKGRSPLNRVFAAINTLPTPVKIGFYTGVGLTMTGILSGCGPQGAAVTHEIANCNGETEIDMAPGSLEKVKASKGGADAEIIINKDETITINGITMAVQPNDYFFGDRTKNHLVVQVQGDTDSDGKTNILAKSVCPAPPPTPMPTSTKTK